MKDKIFIDTNILIYLSSNETNKKEIVKNLIYKLEKASISTQVLGEFSNVIYKKKIFSPEKLISFIEIFTQSFEIELISPEIIINAINIKEKYKFSLWDSMILASAINAKCTIVLSEDMHHNQIIENQLKIINPFK